jgi:hypothetical protein
LPSQTQLYDSDKRAQLNIAVPVLDPRDVVLGGASFQSKFGLGNIGLLPRFFQKLTNRKGFSISLENISAFSTDGTITLAQVFSECDDIFHFAFSSKYFCFKSSALIRSFLGVFSLFF